MRFLLDTHIAIWTINDDPKLNKVARKIIENADANILISAVTIWEISIKHALGRDRKDAISFTGSTALKIFQKYDFDIIDITAGHAALVDDLAPVHGDPFDRLLVAQAIHEGFTLLTHDAKLAEYGDFVMVV
jgi:PIN domain nuclease of toxin-antitoxin system